MPSVSDNDFSNHSQTEHLLFSKKKSRSYDSNGSNMIQAVTPLPEPEVLIEQTPARGKSSGIKTLIVCLVTVLTNVMMNVSLPIYTATMGEVGGDPFVVLLYGAIFYPIVLAALSMLLKLTWDRSISLYPTCRWWVYLVMGLTTTLNGVGVVFASDPSRTAPYLQGVLSTVMIPFTVLCRFIMLRKGISLRRMGCTVAVLIGIFITIEPQIWNLPGSGESSGQSGSGLSHVIWPLIFALGFLPAAINTVVCERELKDEDASSLSFITWSQVAQLVTIIPLFWTDFIPWFGMASSPSDFFNNRLSKGLGCNFSTADHCLGLGLKGWFFIMGYCLGNLFQFILIQRSEGAVFAVVVQSLVTPIATLFWSVFKLDAGSAARADGNVTTMAPYVDFFWSPQFNETTGFTLGGLFIIVPAVLLYNLFSRWDLAESGGGGGEGEKEEDTSKA